MSPNIPAGGIAVVPGLALRCFSCSHSLGFTAVEMRLVGLFKPSMVGRVPRQPGEHRVICRSCRWINLFQPLTPSPMLDTVRTK